MPQRFDERGGHRLQPRLLPLDRAAVLPRDRGQLGPGEAGPQQGRRGADRDREAVRLRPGVGARAEPQRARACSASPGLPHRPLPGQGDRPEPAGLPVRQRDVRADLEPQLHRLRADHRRRGPRDRQPRRLLRQSGALRDLVQNHMLQLLALLCMEPPAAFEADRCATRRSRCCRRSSRRRSSEVREMAVRAQYGPGTVGRRTGARVPARRTACRRDSRTETYAALRLQVQNWRWAGVPFYLRTGKRLARKVTEIAITLKPVPHLAFQRTGSLGVQPNQLILTVQPDEGVSLSLGAKIPGTAHAHPAGQHGVPLRHRVPVAVARGLRAADPRRHARRRLAVHAQRRGRGAVVDLRPGPRGVAATRPIRFRSIRRGPTGRRRPTRCSSPGTTGGSC